MNLDVEMRRYDRLAVIAASRYYGSGLGRGWCTHDDLVSFAREGLWKALVRRDDSAGDFQAYARVVMRGTIIDGVRKYATTGRWLYERGTRADAACSDLDAFESDVMNPEECSVIAERLAMVDAAVAELKNDRLRQFVRRGMLGGEKMQEVASSFGISKSRGSRVMSEARDGFTRNMLRRGVDLRGAEL